VAEFAEGVTEADVPDLVAAYVESAFQALDAGNVGMARAAFRKCGLYLLISRRWDAANGGTYAG